MLEVERTNRGWLKSHGGRKTHVVNILKTKQDTAMVRPTTKRE